jgi:signal peptidase I
MAFPFNLFGKKKTTTSEAEAKPKKKKSALREWIDAIVFAVIAATIIRWAFLSAYTIPTSSMEGTQLVGDFLFVSKITYGPRTPITLLRIPLTDSKIWGTNMASYLDWFRMPYTRLPGFASVKNNDIVVFNYPRDDMELNGNSKGYMPPIDMKTHYIKRCVAIAGDKLEIKEGQVYINDKKVPDAPHMQFKYLVESKQGIREKVFLDMDINIGDVQESYLNSETVTKYEVAMSELKAAEFRKMDFIKKVEKIMQPKGQQNSRIFPQSEEFNWNEDNYGPLTIPKKGMKIAINKTTLATYGTTIQLFDWNKKVEIKDNKLFIDDKEVKEYTFKQDYFFMMGDNRHNSLDSRFWGFVPEDHIVGQASFTWLSLDYKKTWFSKIRWGRMFTGIR